jgi:hypothetical protein
MWPARTLVLPNRASVLPSPHPKTRLQRQTQLALPIEWLQQSIVHFCPFTLQLPLATGAILVYTQGWERAVAAALHHPSLAADVAALCQRVQLALAALQGVTMAVFGCAWPRWRRKGMRQARFGPPAAQSLDAGAVKGRKVLWLCSCAPTVHARLISHRCPLPHVPGGACAPPPHGRCFCMLEALALATLFLVGCALPLAISYWLEFCTKARFARERCGGARLVLRLPARLATAARWLAARTSQRPGQVDCEPRGAPVVGLERGHSGARREGCAVSALTAVLPPLLLAVAVLVWIAVEAAVTLSNPLCRPAAAAAAAGSEAERAGFCVAADGCGSL